MVRKTQATTSAGDIQFQVSLDGITWSEVEKAWATKTLMNNYHDLKSVLMRLLEGQEVVKIRSGLLRVKAVS